VQRLISSLFGLIFLASAPALSIHPLVSLPRADTPIDLINTVNGLRTSLGLTPYQIDAGLMAYAQQHASYIASRDSGTHRHSDGVLPWEIGLQENVAGGDGIEVYDVVYNIWVDEGHRKTMVGYPGGWIGAGIDVAASGTVYYVIDIRPAGVFATGTSAPIATQPFVPLTTSTSQPDGAIIHIVRQGETLWTIAVSYGTTAAEIRRLNGLASDSTLIYTGQRLLIRPAGAATVAPSVEAGNEIAQATGTEPTPTKPTLEPTLTFTSTLEAPASSINSSASLDNSEVEGDGKKQSWLLILGIGALLVAGLLVSLKSIRLAK
jgi:LysM repeat protein